MIRAGSIGGSMSKHWVWTLCAFATVCVGSEAAPPAQTPPPAGPPAARLPLKSALALAQSALSICARQGYAIAVSVVDAAGGALVTLQADGSQAHASTSVKKAATAAFFHAAGSELEKRAAAEPDFASRIAANADYNDHPGSIPLMKDGVLIGGIGATGAPTHEQDEACVSQAAERILKSHR